MATWVQIAVGLVLVLIGGAVTANLPSAPVVGVAIAVIGVFIIAAPNFIGKRKES